MDIDKNVEFLLDGRISVSVFGGPIVEFSGINDDLAISSGGGGALLLNKRFFIGGYGLKTRNNGSLSNGDVQLNHGGFSAPVRNCLEKMANSALPRDLSAYHHATCNPQAY